MRRLGLIGLLVASFVAIACEDEPPQASSRLSRPSGLAYVTRSGARADVFVADSEARGVRVLQLAKLQTTDGQLIDDQVFLSGPVIFFPLVIPAFEFPTALSVTEDGERLYALSPLGPSLHLLDVREAPYGQSAEFVEGYVSLAEFDLNALRGVLGLTDLIGPDAIAVDVDVLPSAGAQDRVAVTFDRVLSPDSLVVVFGVSSDELALELVSTATVSAGPRAAELRRSAPAGLIVSSSATSTVSFLPFSSTSTAVVFDAHRGLFAGGPSIGVVDAADAGVLALRLDRASVVVFDVVEGALRRSTRTSTSPFSVELELGTADARGRIDTFPRALRAGAHGVISSLASSTNFPTDTATAAVALVHVDGTISFLVGRPLSLSLANRTSISRVTRLKSDGVDLVGCQERDDQAGDPLCPLDLAAACEPAVLPNSLLRITELRAEFEGALALRNAGELRATSSTVPRSLDLVDLGAAKFGTRLVAPGHRVLLHYRGAASCESETIVEWVETASVALVSESSPTITLQFDAGSSMLAATPCDGVLPLRRYEVYPRGQVVVTELRADESSPRVTGLFDVAPGPAGGDRVVLDRGPLAVSLDAPAGFSCLEGPVSVGPAPCETDLDCGGATCRTQEASPGSESETARACGRFCSSCSDGDADCFGNFVVRRCTGVTLLVDPAGVTAANPRTLVTDPVTTIPEDVVFSPIRESWIYSLPGARALAEVRTLIAEDGTLVFGGTSEIRASTEAR